MYMRERRSKSRRAIAESGMEWSGWERQTATTLGRTISYRYACVVLGYGLNGIGRREGRGGRGLAWIRYLGIGHEAGRALQLSGPDGRRSRARTRVESGWGETDGDGNEGLGGSDAGFVRPARLVSKSHVHNPCIMHQVLRGRKPESGVLRRPQPPQRGTVGGSRGGPPHSSCPHHAAAVRA